MRFGSVCSGIEAASVAWHPLGWRAAWFSEIEPFPCAVLAHHYPEVPNLGDMTDIPALLQLGEVEAPDLLCGGTPRECERLQGFPDDYTLIPWRGRPVDQCPDGPRYKARGNSWAVPVVRWIGERIAFFAEGLA